MSKRVRCYIRFAMPQAKSNALKSVKPVTSASAKGRCSLRFEACDLSNVNEVIDAVAWMDFPDLGQVAQYSNLDPRTVGKLLKNLELLSVVERTSTGEYRLLLPWPHKGMSKDKADALKEVMVRYPLLISVKQFLQLGESVEQAFRKGATLQGVENYEVASLAPLRKWAQSLGVLDTKLNSDVLVSQAAQEKTTRHEKDSKKRVAFISHSSLDKPFVRRLATDLAEAGIEVWLDEQQIKVGDSIPDLLGQALVKSDFFLLASSVNSAKSEWVKKELGTALMEEVARQKVMIFPLKLDGEALPPQLRDKKYANFAKSYSEGYEELLSALTQKVKP